MDASIAIDTSRRLGLISPLLYGLRGADTFKNDTPLMWVGPDSPIANIDGVRKGTVEALREIQPGFMSGLVGAEWYRWQDGIGPRDQRPVRVSYWGRSAFEAANMEWRNEFGTEEFLHLCRLVGTQPMMICNAEDPIGSRDWVEYCNWDGASTFAEMRAANGHHAPHGVSLWNMYGWMDMEPEEYASSFRRFASGVRPLDPTVKLIAAGGGEEWNRRFFDKLKRCMSQNFGGPDVVDYLSQIYYTGQSLPDVDYSDEQYYRVLQNSFAIDSALAAGDEFLQPLDAERQPWGIGWLHMPEIGTPTIQLAILEWGTVHFMHHQTMREAIAHAIFLDRFHKWAARVTMASVFLNMVIQSRGDQLVLTPTYHLYDLYRPHRGKQSVAVDVDCPQIRGGDFARPEDSKGSGGAVAGMQLANLPELPMLSASASVGEDESTLFVTVTNCHLTEPAVVRLEVVGAGEWRMTARRHLTSGNVRDCNDVHCPDSAGLEDLPVGELLVTIPPFSVQAITLTR